MAWIEITFLIYLLSDGSHLQHCESCHRLLIMKNHVGQIPEVKRQKRSENGPGSPHFFRCNKSKRSISESMIVPPHFNLHFSFVSSHFETRTTERDFRITVQTGHELITFA